MGDQLLEGQAREGGMTPVQQVLQTRIEWRPVQEPQRLGQTGQSQRRQDLRRQQLDRTRRLHERECLIGQAAPARLLEPLGRGIDGGQSGLGDLGRGVLEPVFGMHDLQRLGSLPRLAVATQTLADPQGRRLLAGEMKEPQQQPAAGVVAEQDLERTPAAGGDGGVEDLALDHGLAPRLQIEQRCQPGAILVAQRQVEEQILHRADPELAEPLGDPWTHAVQPVDGQVVQPLRAGRRIWGDLCQGGRLGLIGHDRTGRIQPHDEEWPG